MSKKPKIAHSEPSYSRMASGVKLGFASTGGASTLTAEQMATLKAAILKTTLSTETAGLSPQFEGCVPRSGWQLLVWHNNNGAEWVRRNFSLIKTNSSLDVELLEEGQFPRASLVRGYFANSLELSNEKVLAYVGRQNDLNTTQWRVVQRNTQGEMLHLAIMVEIIIFPLVGLLRASMAWGYIPQS